MGEGSATATPARAHAIAVWLLILAGCAAIAASAVGVFTGGIGWDVEFDVAAYIQVTELGEIASLADAYERVTYTSEFYGILLPQIAHALWGLLGPARPFGPGDLAVYQLLSILNVAIAAIGAAAIGVAVGVALRSRLAGAFAWAAVAALPLWSGLAHVDWKDVPIATGVSLISAGMVLSHAARSTRGRWGAGVALTACGAVLALTSRPGAWPLAVAVLAGSLGWFVALDLVRRQPRALLPAVTAVAAGTAAAFLALWLTNPIARLEPLPWLRDAALVSQNNPWWGVVRTAGIDVNANNLPLWYPVAWLLAQLPLLTLATLVLAGLAVIASLAGWSGGVPRPALLMLVPIAIQGVLLPAMVVWTRPVIYDGIRHLLFMVPALVGLSGIAVAAAERALRGSRPGRALVVPVAACLVVAASLAATIRWSPYEYAFVNPVAGRNHDARHWELDFWGVSAREGVQRLHEAGYEPVAVLPTDATSRYAGSVLPDSPQATGAGEYGLYVFYRGEASLGDCTELFTIRRDGHALGAGAVCRNAGAP